MNKHFTHKIKMSFTGYIVIFLLGYLSFTSGCDEIMMESRHCVSDGEFTLSCPTNHLMVVKGHDYMKSSVAGECPPVANTTDCKVADKMDEVLQCFGQSCTINPVARTSPECTGDGEDYVYIKYICEPLHNTADNTKALALCNTDPLFTGSMIHIDSHPLGLLKNYINSSDCGCEVFIQPNTETHLHMLFWQTEPTQPTICNQKLTVWDDDFSKVFCKKDFVELPCTDQERHLKFRYENTNQDIGIIFVLKVLTPFTKTALSVKCGIDVASLGITTTTTPTTTTTTPTTTTTTPTTTTTTPTTTTTTPTTTTTTPTTTTTSTSTSTTTTTPTTTTTTTAPETTSLNEVTGAVPQTSSKEWKTPVIIGAVIISILILIMVILIVLIRLRNDHNALEEETPSEGGDSTMPDYKYITQLYLDGDQKTNLVANSATNGYMTTKRI